MTTGTHAALEALMQRMLAEAPEEYVTYARLAARMTDYPEWVVSSVSQSF